MSDNDDNKEVAMKQDEQQAPDDTSNWDDKDATAGDDPQKYIRTTDSPDIVQQ
jgi:hypothetical protein